MPVSKFKEPNRAQPLDLEGAIRIHDGNLNHNGGSNLTSTQPILVINAAQILCSVIFCTYTPNILMSMYHAFLIGLLTLVIYVHWFLVIGQMIIL